MNPGPRDVGWDVAAVAGMAEAEVATPALVLRMNALERNLAAMQAAADAAGVALRPHGKMHRCSDLARLQVARGAVGLCAQKVAEAEAFVRGGIADVLVSNEVRDPAKLARLAALPRRGARIAVCVDAPGGVDDLAAAVAAAGTGIDVLVELDVGAGRCGVATPAKAVALARAIDAAPGLRFRGLQAYHGGAQHVADAAERASVLAGVIASVAAAVDALRDAGLPPGVVTGAGTGSWPAEAGSGLYTELQCGSYAVLDGDYARIGEGTGRLDDRWAHALFVVAQVMSVQPGRAVLDAGHKAVAIDSGLPRIDGRPDLEVIDASDEHFTVADPGGTLAVRDRVHLIPMHCDPTFNLHDDAVCLRGGAVEAVWPIDGRGRHW